MNSGRIQNSRRRRGDSLESSRQRRRRTIIDLTNENEPLGRPPVLVDLSTIDDHHHQEEEDDRPWWEPHTPVLFGDPWPLEEEPLVPPLLLLDSLFFDIATAA